MNAIKETDIVDLATSDDDTEDGEKQHARCSATTAVKKSRSTPVTSLFSEKTLRGIGYRLLVPAKLRHQDDSQCTCGQFLNHKAKHQQQQQHKAEQRCSGGPYGLFTASRLSQDGSCECDAIDAECVKTYHSYRDGVMRVELAYVHARCWPTRSVRTEQQLLVYASGRDDDPGYMGTYVARVQTLYLDATGLVVNLRQRLLSTGDVCDVFKLHAAVKREAFLLGQRAAERAASGDHLAALEITAPVFCNAIRPDPDRYISPSTYDALRRNFPLLTPESQQASIAIAISVIEAKQRRVQQEKQQQQRQQQLRQNTSAVANK